MTGWSKDKIEGMEVSADRRVKDTKIAYGLYNNVPRMMTAATVK